MKENLATHRLGRCGKNYKMMHQDQVWSPFVIDGVQNKAIYDTKRFKTSNKSIEFVKQKIKEGLDENLKGIDVSKDTISFIVLMNGKIHDIEFTGSKKVENSIAKTLKNLDKDWFPALITKGNLRLMDDMGDRNVKIKTNSRVVIPLD